MKDVEEDYYEAVNKINKSIKNVDNIFDDSKESDPEFYEELKEILTKQTTG